MGFLVGRPTGLRGGRVGNLASWIRAETSFILLNVTGGEIPDSNAIFIFV